MFSTKCRQRTPGAPLNHFYLGIICRVCLLCCNFSCCIPGWSFHFGFREIMEKYQIMGLPSVLLIEKGACMLNVCVLVHLRSTAKRGKLRGYYLFMQLQISSFLFLYTVQFIVYAVQHMREKKATIADTESAFAMDNTSTLTSQN